MKPEAGSEALEPRRTSRRHRALDVVTFGESMGLLTAEGERGIEYAGRMSRSFGGAESNLAIALSRLGHPVGWFGHLGKDPLGAGILKAIRGEGVDVSMARQRGDAPTGLMLKEQVGGRTSVYYYRRGSAASRMGPEDVPAGYIGSSRFLHITGITCAISASAREAVLEAVRAARSLGVQVSFDPNLRLKLWTVEEAREALLPLAEEADFFLPGLDEARLLFGIQDEGRLIERLQQLRGITIVKSAGERTLLVEKEKVTEVPFVKVDRVADPVGAGDGFCAGFLSGLLREQSPEEAVRLGSLVGAMVVRKPGDWEGMPTWEELEAYRSELPEVER